MHVALWTGEFCWILHFDENYEVKVMPHVMLTANVFFKGHIFIVKCLSFKSWKEKNLVKSRVWIKIRKKKKSKFILTTDEAGILQGFLFLLLFRSEISKRVNDNTKDQIENNNNDEEKE